ncbi:MAG: hypothetical protein GWP61_18800 [Chloroflexi bacterium]|jgi:hypothetical protein|nr:hypothetical protein [Chloroflexota bacterium]
MLNQLHFKVIRKVPRYQILYQRRYRKWLRFLIPVIQLVVMAGTTGFVLQQVDYCPLYNTVVTWIRTLAAILTVLAVLYLGGTKLAASIVPDIGIRTGAVAVGIAFGLILVAFGQDIAGAVIAAFGLPAVTC